MKGNPWGDAWLMERKGEKIRHDRDNVFKRKKMTRSSRKKSGGGGEMYKKGNGSHYFLIFKF